MTMSSKSEHYEHYKDVCYCGVQASSRIKLKHLSKAQIPQNCNGVNVLLVQQSG